MLMDCRIPIALHSWSLATRSTTSTLKSILLCDTSMVCNDGISNTCEIESMELNLQWPARRVSNCFK